MCSLIGPFPWSTSSNFSYLLAHKQHKIIYISYMYTYSVTKFNKHLVQATAKPTFFIHYSFLIHLKYSTRMPAKTVWNCPLKKSSLIRVWTTFNLLDFRMLQCSTELFHRNFWNIFNTTEYYQKNANMISPIFTPFHLIFTIKISKSNVRL